VRGGAILEKPKNARSPFRHCNCIAGGLGGLRQGPKR
jgi:hypothetical protein